MESSQSTPTLSAAAPGASPLKSAHEPNLSAAGERGMAKITDAAVKYDRIRDRAAMESFQGRSLLCVSRTSARSPPGTSLTPR